MKILLPVDGSEHALDAVRHVIRLAKGGQRVNIVLVNVQEPPSLYEMVVSRDADMLERVSGSAARHSLADAEDLLSLADVPFEKELLTGEPATTLLEAGERHDCDAVVLGARGRGEARGALGSVSQAMVQGAPVPVTIVRSGQSHWLRPSTA